MSRNKKSKWPEEFFGWSIIMVIVSWPVKMVSGWSGWEAMVFVALFFIWLEIYSKKNE